MGIHKFDNVEPEAYARLIAFARDERNASIGKQTRTPIVRILKVVLARNAVTSQVMSKEEIAVIGQLSIEIIIAEELRKHTADDGFVDVTTTSDTVNTIFEIIGKYPKDPNMKRASDRD